jgi:hypothetical protein
MLILAQMGGKPQGDRIFIPRIDVDEQLEGDRIPGPWFIHQGSTWLLLLEIAQFITATRGRKVDCLARYRDQTCCSISSILRRCAGR